MEQKQPFVAPVITFGAPSVLEGSPILGALKDHSVVVKMRDDEEFVARVVDVEFELGSFVLSVGHTDLWRLEAFDAVKFMVVMPDVG